MGLNFEDYIRAAYYLQKERGQVGISKLAGRLGVSKNTASIMVGKLSFRGFFRHKKYGKIDLSKKGKRWGKSLTYKHRLIELFLHRVLDVPKGKVHNEACRLEHDFGKESIEGMRKMLGNPKACPHGKPILG